MKKLVMAMAIALAAVAAQAEQVYVALDTVNRAGTTDEGISANGYFIYGDILAERRRRVAAGEEGFMSVAESKRRLYEEVHAR